MTILLALNGGMPFSGRPFMMIVVKLLLGSFFSDSTSGGPTSPSCSAPWQRSQASARQVFQPVSVFASTLLPSLTL